jgi:hypothetical protein
VDGGVCRDAALAYPAMRELLRQCIAEAQADVAFVALLDADADSNGAALVVPAMFPPSERTPSTVTRWVKAGVLQAIKAGRTEAMVARTTSSGNRRARSKMLVVAPMYSCGGAAWGAVVVIRASAVIEWDIINPIQQCAHAITTVLTESDDPCFRRGAAAPRPPLARQRVQSRPREDFLLHELRVPLSAAAYALEALVQHHGPNWTCDDEDLLHTAQSGVEEAQKIARSVSQWPALGRGVSKPPVGAIALDEMLERALALLPGARRVVVQHMDPDLPLVYGNESWITQVLLNLLENAMKYSDAQRHIDVTSYQSDGDVIVVRVHSWGSICHLQRGYSAARSGEHDGSTDDPTSKGLGLNIARYFVTSLGGNLRIEDNGTGDFTVTVSLLAAPPVAYPAGNLQQANA